MSKKTMKLGENALVVAQDTKWNGKERFDLRIWFYADNGKLLPTQKGISVPAERKAELKRLLA